jgi:hypothetical protein
MDGMKRYYPPTNFPRLWQEIDGLIAEGRLLASEEVWEEVKIHDDELKDWVQAREAVLIVPTTAAVAAEVRQVLAGNMRLVMNMKGRNRADPFVIGVARMKSATVVTGEGSDGTATRPKIPYVCQQLGVPCIRLLDLIRTEGWVF